LGKSAGEKNGKSFVPPINTWSFQYTKKYRDTPHFIFYCRCASANGVQILIGKKASAALFRLWLKTWFRCYLFFSIRWLGIGIPLGKEQRQ
jgi:hypothetical protein